MQIESWGPFAEGKNNIFQNELLLSLAGKYQKTVAQIILRWLTQRGVVAIPKSVRKERIVENFNVFDVRTQPRRHGCDCNAGYKNEQLLRSSRSEHRENVEWGKTQHLRTSLA